jgi:hypothetical protein
MSLNVENVSDVQENMPDMLQDVSPETREIPLVANFSEYQDHCDDQADGFRHNGLLGAESYQKAVQDETTIFAAIDGKLMPAVTSVDNESFYQASRCRNMTGSETVGLLTLPLRDVESGVIAEDNLYGNDKLPPHGALIVEEFASYSTGEERQRAHELIAAGLNALGPLKPKEFLHPGLASNEEHQSAWMAIYALSIAPTEYHQADSEATPEQRLESAWRAYRDERGLPEMPDEAAESAYMFTAEQLREHPEIVEGLWQISESGFGDKLGAHHPISMAVTREFFDQQLLSDGMFTTVRYHEGIPVCFGQMALNMDHNPWLNTNSSELSEELSDAATSGETLAHFFELISGGERGMGYSPDILQTFLELAGRTGEDYKVIFESTNLSSLYIPPIVTKQVTEAPGVQLKSPIESLGRLNYFYLSAE